ncbi:MAG: glycosidase [Candidatus Marinimicrobia bacterium]|nr:glycosidase [Candidatus Neomarinimicrobiota bacterium]
MSYPFDKILFSPQDIDTSKLPIALSTGKETFVLGAFNPGFCRLPNGNTLMMVRVAEALQHPRSSDQVGVLRFDPEANTFLIDHYLASDIDFSDPRKYKFRNVEQVYALTSLSWLLPVELNPQATSIVKIHYDKMILPEHKCQEYGLEDARISRIDSTYYMTACAVGSDRHSSVLYQSEDGLNYAYLGMILDHQNKDMVIFPEKIHGKYHALTRPLGELYFVDPNPHNHPGPGVNISASPDMLHWRPLETVLLKPSVNKYLSRKVGGGAPPIRMDQGWLILYHGVSDDGLAGIYRTFWMILDLDDPQVIIHNNVSTPLLEANPALTRTCQDSIYLSDIVFTTGVIDAEDHYIIASGELDLCCRITHIPHSVIHGEKAAVK